MTSGRSRLKQRRQFRRGADIPDVDAHANNLRVPREQDLCDVHGTLVDVELNDIGPGFEVAEVGEQAAQAERPRGCTWR